MTFVFFLNKMASYKSFFLQYNSFIEPDVFFKEMIDLFQMKGKEIKWMIWGNWFGSQDSTFVYLKLNKKVKVDSNGPLSILYYGKRITPKMFSSRKQTEIFLFFKKKFDYFSQYNININEYLKKKKKI